MKKSILFSDKVFSCKKKIILFEKQIADKNEIIATLADQTETLQRIINLTRRFAENSTIIPVSPELLTTSQGIFVFKHSISGITHEVRSCLASHTTLGLYRNFLLE